MKAFLKVAIAFVTIQGISSLTQSCSTIDFGSSYESTCETLYSGYKVDTTIKLKACRDNPKLTVKIAVPGLGVDWTKTFNYSQIVAVSTLTIGGNGVFVDVKMNSRSGTTNLKVQFVLYSTHGHSKTLLATLLDRSFGEAMCKSKPDIEALCKSKLGENLCKSEWKTDYDNWWDSKSDVIKGIVIGGAALFVIVLIACCCVCCYRKKKRQPAKTFVMKPPTTSPGNIVVNNTLQQQQGPFAPMSDLYPIRENANNHDRFNYQKLNNEI